MAAPKRTDTPYGEPQRMAVRIMYLLLWLVPGLLGFVAGILYQGIVIGWKSAMDLLDRT